MKILVTGATGFIGGAIVKDLKSRGLDVTALVRKTSNTDSLKEKGIPYRLGDVNDPDSLASAFQGIDVLIHTAGKVTDWGKTKDFIKANYEGTQNLLEACKKSGVRRIVYFSTVDVFGGDHNAVYNEGSPLKQLPGGYDKSKTMAEKMVRQSMEDGPLNITIVYPPWVYGEGDQHFVPEIIQSIKDGSMLFFRNGGEHIVEINYIGNLTEAIFTIINNDQSIGKGFILSDEPKVSMKTFVNTLAKEMGYEDVKFTLAYPLSYMAAFLMESIYKLLRMKQRPLLTRQAVILLGNNIIYDTTNLKSIGYHQKYRFEDIVKSIV